MDLESYEGQVILKDKFLTQSAFDSRRKLQKLLQGPRVSLGETLTPASTDFHNHDHERETRAQERERQKKTRHCLLYTSDAADDYLEV